MAEGSVFLVVPPLVLQLVGVLSAALQIGMWVNGPPLAPFVWKAATDMGLCRAIGRGPVSCAFHWLGSPQPHQGEDTGSPLMGMGTATRIFSDAALLV